VRLATVSALLTFVILCGFALVVGSLTVHRIRADFNRDVAASASNLAGLVQVNVTGNYAEGFDFRVVNPPNLDKFGASEHAVIRILNPSGEVLASTKGAPNLGLASEVNEDGYRVEAREEALGPPVGGRIVVQYARRLSDVQATIARVELLLVLGVLAGSGLALLAGATIARRAMLPIARLTSTAAEIARTRDPSLSVPEPEADDEVAELARTLRGMLGALEDAHAETEAMLDRQRRFVADASHELRTPLTSVLANLELLAESLHGDQGDAARSALRSSQRMRRLVADLLLLARTDVGRVLPREPCDLAQIVVDATAELGPVSSEHDITLDVHPAVIQADHDELLRLVLNLLENALRHTPPGTSIRVSTATGAGGIPSGARPAGGGGETGGSGTGARHDRREAVLIVEDDGPGVPEELAPTLFERFVRGAGDRGGSFGLGLAIVRAVAESHGGSVTLEPTHPTRGDNDGRGGATPDVGGGARFVVRLPLAPAQPAAERVAAELRSVV
jgi:two-component system, OmpR family, sensor kinase